MVGADVADDPGGLRLGVLTGPQRRRLADRPGRAEHLLGAAELRDEPVRELEGLRRRPVVLLEAEDLPAGAQQVVGDAPVKE